MKIDVTPAARAFRIFKRDKCFHFCQSVSELPLCSDALVHSIEQFGDLPIGWLPNHPYIERENPDQNGKRFLLLTDKAIYDLWAEKVTRYCYSDMGWPSWHGNKSDLDRGGVLSVSAIRGSDMQLPVNFCDRTGASIFSVWRYLIAICHRERTLRSQQIK